MCHVCILPTPPPPPHPTQSSPLFLFISLSLTSISSRYLRYIIFRSTISSRYPHYIQTRGYEHCAVRFLNEVTSFSVASYLHEINRDSLKIKVMPFTFTYVHTVINFCWPSLQSRLPNLFQCMAYIGTWIPCCIVTPVVMMKPVCDLCPGLQLF